MNTKHLDDILRANLSNKCIPAKLNIKANNNAMKFSLNISIIISSFKKILLPNTTGIDIRKLKLNA